MSHSYAYLSQGQLHLKLGNGPVCPIDSKFVVEEYRLHAASLRNPA